MGYFDLFAVYFGDFLDTIVSFFTCDAFMPIWLMYLFVILLCLFFSLFRIGGGDYD